MVLGQMKWEMSMVKMGGKPFFSALSIVFCSAPACQLEQRGSVFANSMVLEEYLNVWPTQVLQPRLQKLQSQNLQLQKDLRHWIQVSNSGEVVLRQQQNLLQEDWRQLMLSWQELEVMQFEALGSSLEIVAGRDLRDEIYSWPNHNPCLLDQVIAHRSFDHPEFWSNPQPLNPGLAVYGLDALEYLLFSDATSACPSQVSPISDGLWVSLGSEKVRQYKMEYALQVAQHLHHSFEILEQSWQHGFSIEQYRSKKEVLEMLLAGMLYLDTHSKDLKLGRPLGLMDCSSSDCHLEVEGYFANVGSEWIAANMKGFQAIFFESQPNLSDVLKDIGAESLAIDIGVQSDKVLQLCQNISDHHASEAMSVALQANPEPYVELHQALVDLNAVLKWQLAPLLQLDIPTDAAGDND